MFFVFLLSKPISAYQMGEAYAQNMGLNVSRFRIVLVIRSSILSASVTAFAGPVSFVGIAVPHLVKGLLDVYKRQGVERFVPPLLVVRRILRRTERKQGCPVSGHPFQKGQGDLWRFIIWRPK